MTEFTRIRTVPARRGPVSAFNDNTLEYLIAAARVASVLAALAAIGCTVGLIWTGDIRWALSLALTAAVAAAAGWFGLIHYANEEWGRNGTSDE